MSMRTETLSLVISGDGKQLSAELGKSERKVKTFSGRVGGMFRGIGKSIGGAVGKLSPFALIGGTAGIMMAARNLMDYQDTLSSLGIRAGLTAGEMMYLDKKIHSLAYTTGQGRESLVAGLRTMTDDVDTDFAVEAIEHVGMAATAMSIDINEAARAFIAFRRDMGATAEEATKMFNTMAAMDGTIAVDRVANAVQTLGLNKDNLGQYNALIHTIKTNMGGAEQAAKAVDDIAMKIQSDRRVRREIQRRGGGDLFDSDGNIKDFRKFMSFIGSQSAELRNRMFGKNSRAFLEFEGNGKGFEVFDGYIKAGQEAGFITDAFAHKQQEAKFQLNKLTSAAKELGAVALAPMLEKVTRQLTKLTSDPAALNRMRDGFEGIAGVAGNVLSIILKIGEGLGVVANWSERQGAKLAQHHRRPRGIENRTAALRRELEAESRLQETPAQRRGTPEFQSAHEERLRRMAALCPNPVSPQVAAPPNITVANPVNLNINIAESGRVITSSDSPNTSITCNLNRGRF